MVQPWMGIVASFGAPMFRTQPTTCRKGSVRLCGATPAGTHLSLERVGNERTKGGGGENAGFGWLELLGNNSHAALSRAAVGGFRLSTTSNLVRVSRKSGCVLHLGVGHVHRSEGELNRKMAMIEDLENGQGNASAAAWRRLVRRRRRQLGQPGETSAGGGETFKWGFQYTHFLYALEPYPPFRVVATSREFCIAAEQNATDCESIQFVSGLTVARGGSTLILSYGVNDCEAKASGLPLGRVWDMLQPLDHLEGSGAAAARQCFG